MAENESIQGRARRRAPIHLWIVGGLTLLWNMMGAFDYLATQLKLDFYMSQFTTDQLAGHGADEFQQFGFDLAIEILERPGQGHQHGVEGGDLGSDLFFRRRKTSGLAGLIGLFPCALAHGLQVVL